ncbi:hypothetical protein TI04_12020, partial [Achromatium sp. WMS2]
QVRQNILRNEAKAVANQVVAFRAWVAQTGMVWVNNLAVGFTDYLAERPDGSGHAWYGKNPALATRELSTIVNASNQHATFRVTSDEYRHKSNAPDAFEANAITVFKSSKKLEYYDGFENTWYRYAQPIYVEQACLRCHGKPEDAPPEVIAKYGSIRAFGYKVGDIRGIISVKLPDITLLEIASTLVNPLSIGIVILAFLINFIFVNNGIIRRIYQLTNDTASIADGTIDTKLHYADKNKSHDEIDHLSYSIDLLRNSLQIAMRYFKK